MNRRVVALIAVISPIVTGFQPATGSARLPVPPADTVRFAVRAPDYWPTIGWRESTPEEQGLSGRALAKAVDQVSERGLPLHNLLIIRHGVVVLDANVYPFAAGRHDIASITKSVTSLLVGAAVERRILPPPATALFEVLPNRPARTDSRKQSMTLGNLLGMQSGLDCGFGRGEPELHAMMKREDWVQDVLDLPMRSSPGTAFGYCSGNYHVLSAVISARAHASEYDFARQVLFKPLGIADVLWPADPAGLSHGWGDLQLRPRDLAKLAFLMLHGGEWDGHRVVSREWIEWSTRPRVKYGNDSFYGNGWWTHPASPPGFYEGIGRGGQRLSVWPEKDLIVVVTGGGFRPDDIASFLREAIVSDTALPPDPEAAVQLRASIRRAAAAPAARRIESPACVSGLSGIPYRVGKNSLDLRSFTLAFPTGDSAFARLHVGKYDLLLPIGLDGVYRVSPTPIDGIVPVSRGTWRQPCEFILDLNLVGKIDRYTLAIAFDQRNPATARVSLSEVTGLLHEEASATASRQ